ncbi:glycerophosphodiester phosphodiesterase family protein [Phycicoccus sonneratiae]|uniref:Glycerophosphodiester phosphodiesterase n=1 Tax=Phycicoccus sonneratiae TaxID=2807628 RepID=A0ABS2CGT0_9MICO|nr:glycerophosphodiester phosphodiesterase family protein [Phycicoccus sonneraticus]MBM6399081.1 glycerophosphodiester phosphodiesterase [Phycicoccus sonneraticus]
MRAADFAYLSAPGPLALAHRGGAKLAENVGLENTLVAFGRAVAMGYRYLETDVHATSDGQVVAFHDVALDRVTDGTGHIARLPWARVREARVGGVEPVPLLADLLEAFPTARVNIDVKADDALAPTLEVIRAHGATGRVCIGSFSPRRVRAARRALGPGVATAAGQVGTALLRVSPALVSRLLHTPAPVLQIPAEHRVGGRTVTLVTPGLVRRAHGLGKQVHVWFHDWSREDADEFHRLLDLGVDGLVADRIDVLRDVLAERGHPLTPGSEG